MTVTGGTYNSNTGVATFTTNSGNTFNVSGFLTGFTDIYLTGASYNSGTGVLTLTNTNGSTVTASGFNTGSGGGGVIVAGSGFLSAIRAQSGSLATAGNSIVLGINSTNNSDWATITGGINNTIGACSPTAVLGGGICNTSCQSPFSFMGGGCMNKIVSSTVGGVQGSVLVGGVSNLITNVSSLSFIGTGGSNTINDSGGSAILVGSSNQIVCGQQSTILGGQSNLICGSLTTGVLRGAIITGCCNKILGQVNGSVFNSSIVAGECNTVQLGCSFIGSGCKNTILGTVTSTTSTILGGSCNTIIGLGITDSSILGGERNTLITNKSFVVGSNIVTDRDCATFVNNLSIKNIPTSSANLPSGSVWRCTTDNTLRIVP